MLPVFNIYLKMKQILELNLEFFLQSLTED